jgi:PAS domain S-box-containing protein
MTPLLHSTRVRRTLAVSAVAIAVTLGMIYARFLGHRATLEGHERRMQAMIATRGAQKSLLAAEGIARLVAGGDAPSRGALDSLRLALGGQFDALGRVVPEATPAHEALAVARAHEGRLESAWTRLMDAAAAPRPQPAALERKEAARAVGAAVHDVDAALGAVGQRLMDESEAADAREQSQRVGVAVAFFLIVVAASGVAVWATASVERQVSATAAEAQRFASMMQAMEDGVVLQDAAGVIHVWNAAAERILGLTGDQLAGRTSFDPRWRAIDEDGRDLPGERHPAMLALASGRPVLGVMGVERPDGVRAWLKVNAVPVSTPLPGLPAGAAGARSVVVTFADVTAEREATFALEESEARYRLIAEMTSEGIVRVDGAMRITYVNSRMAELLGLPPERIRGRHVAEFVHPDDHEQLAARFDDRRAGRRDHYDLRLVNAAGETRWVSNSSVPLFDAAGDFVGALGVVSDLSERRALEAEVRQAHKMDAMGRMASAVAHDVNNLLTVVRSVANLQRDRAATGGELARDLDEILGAVDRGAALTAQLLAFSRALPAEPREVAVAPLLRDFRTTVTRLVPAYVRVRVAVEGDESLLRVQADPMQVERALLNLAGNAADAMPVGGELEVRATLAELEEPLPSPYGAIPAGRHVCLAVRDTGSGMDEAVLAHLFEPFFSTKPQGRGTGLGLATVYGIVQQAGGGVTVESAPGVGTTVTLWLPVSTRGAATTPPRAVASLVRGSTPVPADAPLLLVDDEAAVRDILARVLEAQGHAVLVAASAADALQVVAREDGRLRAIITDVRMPGMTGVELVRALARDGREYPVLYLSGQLDKPVTLARDGRHPQAFLAKPFRNRDLVEALERILPQRVG